MISVIIFFSISLFHSLTYFPIKQASTIIQTSRGKPKTATKINGIQEKSTVVIVPNSFEFVKAMVFHNGNWIDMTAWIPEIERRLICLDAEGEWEKQHPVDFSMGFEKD